MIEPVKQEEEILTKVGIKPIGLKLLTPELKQEVHLKSPPCTVDTDPGQHSQQLECGQRVHF